MKKKRMDQRGAMGMVARPSGYTTNTSPGPAVRNNRGVGELGVVIVTNVAMLLIMLELFIFFWLTQMVCCVVLSVCEVRVAPCTDRP